MWLWKLFRLLKERPHWYGKAKGRWVTFTTTILWDFFGSLDSLGYMEVKLLISLQGKELFTSLLEQNWPWGGLKAEYKVKD